MIEGRISEPTVDMEFKLHSKECGPATAFFYIEIEDGPPVSFQVQADFRGPIVTVNEAVIDCGLSKVNTDQDQVITLKNESPIPAEFIIKSARNKKLTFDSLIPEENASQSSVIVDKPAITRKGNSINMSTYSKVLGPHESLDINLNVHCITEETIDEHIEILIREGKPLFLQVLGEVQKPKVYLNRSVIELGKIYAGVKEAVEADMGKHKTQALELVNYGNLPATFRWCDRNERGVIASAFEPSEGRIPPKSKVRISFEMTTYKGGPLDELFMCDVDDLELPLGFEVHGDAFGLNVAYLTSEEQSTMQSTQHSFVEDEGIDLGGLNRLRMLNFTECRINKPLSKKFVLKNLSGIASSFNFEAAEFEPISHVAPQ